KRCPLEAHRPPASTLHAKLMNSLNRQSMLPGMEEAPLAIATRAKSRATADANPRPDGPVADVSGTTRDAPDLAGKSVWVVDAHSLIFQVFHAIPEMSSPRGQAVNAVYGFTRDVLFLLESKRPDYFFCAFDMDGLTFRHELFANYKKDRKEMPD